MNCRTKNAIRWLLIVAAACLTSAGTLGPVWSQQPAEKVQQEKSQSSSEALMVYADAANFQNNGAFELAAEEWAKFLKRFAEDPLVPKARHYLGVCLIQLKQFDKAADTFQAVIDKHPKFELLEDAYLNLGWSQYSLAQAGDKSQYAKAATTFAKLAQAYPKGKYTDQALYFRGESLYAIGEKKEAALAYGRLVTSHPKSKLRCDALYALGVTLEEMSQWAQAGKAYDKFLADCAGNDLATEVRMRKAETILQQGDVAAAEQKFAEVANVKGFDAADHALFRQAYCAARQEKFADAAGLYAAVTKRFPKSPNMAESILSAGRCYYRARQYDQAATWFQRALADGGNGAPEAAHWIARIYLRQGKPEKVTPLVGKILPKADKSPFAANLKLDEADALYEIDGRRADALERYVALFKSHPQHNVAPQALYNAAFAALELKLHARAAELADKFLKSFPKDALVPDTLYVAAECRIQKKEYSQAEALYRRLVKDFHEHSESESWRVRLGLVLYLEKKYQEAIDWLTPLISQLQSAGAKAEAHYVVGLCHFQQNHFPEAAKALRASLLADAKWRQADETLLYLAKAQLKLKQLDAAQASLALLLKSFPDSRLLDQAYYHLGEIHYAASRHADAVGAYEQVLKKWPKSPFVPFSLYGKGWALMKSNTYDRADACFTQLIAIDPPHRLRSDALLARGMCRRQEKKYTEAIADIDQYLATKPNPTLRADALYERGLAGVAARDFQKAIATFLALLSEKPDYAAADKVTYELAWAYRSAGDTAKAAGTFAALAKNYPDSPLAAEAFFHAAEDQYGKRQYARAVEIYQQALEHAKGAVLREKIIYKLGWTYFQTKRFKEAADQFDHQLRDYAGGDLAADGQFMKAECLFKLKDYEKALAAFVEAQRQKPPTPQIAVLIKLHGAQAAGQLGQWKQSLELIESLPKDYPQSPYLSEIYFECARAREELGQLDEAINDYQQAVDRSRGEIGARAQFMIGEIRFKQKKHDQAVKDFQRVMYRYGTEKIPTEIRPWQAKAGFEAARCSEVQIQAAKNKADRDRWIADARKFYDYVIQQHPESELATQARKRLKTLAKL